ncbi:hypothetical protein Tco_0703744, partial [Tanacetum coccineum]
VSNPSRSFTTKHESIACPADADCSLPLLIKYLVTFWDIWLAVSGLKVGCDYAYIIFAQTEQAAKIQINSNSKNIVFGSGFSDSKVHKDIRSWPFTVVVLRNIGKKRSHLTLSNWNIKASKGLSDVVRTRRRTSSVSTNSGLQAAGALNSKINDFQCAILKLVTLDVGWLVLAHIVLAKNKADTHQLHMFAETTTNSRSACGCFVLISPKLLSFTNAGLSTLGFRGDHGPTHMSSSEDMVLGGLALFAPASELHFYRAE